MPDYQVRFEQKYIASSGSGCWMWIGAIDSKGYGRFFLGGINRRAHRVSWEVHRGEIPVGLSVIHRCDSPSCVNPEHLILATHKENMRDMAEKKRSRHPDQKGEKHSQAKLTEADVRKIRKDDRTAREIARALGVSEATICIVKKRRRWTHVD